MGATRCVGTLQVLRGDGPQVRADEVPGMEYVAEFTSTAMAIGLVAIGLLLLQRSYGIAFLETVPLATGLSLFFLSLLRPSSVSTIRASALIIPTACCAIVLLTLEPHYTHWRLRVAGESTTLLLSFALMNCCLLLSSLAT